MKTSLITYGMAGSTQHIHVKKYGEKMKNLSKFLIACCMTFLSIENVSAAAMSGIVQQMYVANDEKAVPVTYKEKLFERLSVKDFGAKGDGVTDDTVALNNAAKAAGKMKKALIVPAGVYKTTSTWVIPVKVYVLGETLSVQHSYDPGAEWNYGSVIYKAHNGDAITKTGASAYEEGAPIENICISSNRTLFPAGNGIVLDKVSNVHLIRCTAFGIGGDCFVFGVSDGDVTGHNYAINCYSNNPNGVHYRVRQKWGRFFYPVTDGGTHGMLLNNAPETHVEGFHFEGFKTAAVRMANANTSTRFGGKGFVGNTANAAAGFLIDDAIGNSGIVIENVKMVGSSVAGSKAIYIGSNAIDIKISKTEMQGWDIGIDNNAAYGLSMSRITECDFYACGLPIRSNAENTYYVANKFEATTGGYEIDHISGTQGLWSGNILKKPIKPTATGINGDFAGVRVKENIGYITRSSGTTPAITTYTQINHGLSGKPALDFVITTNSTGVTSVPQIASNSETSFSLYWTGTTSVQWNWSARLPCDY